MFVFVNKMLYSMLQQISVLSLAMVTAMLMSRMVVSVFLDGPKTTVLIHQPVMQESAHLLTDTTLEEISQATVMPASANLDSDGKLARHSLEINV